MNMQKREKLSSRLGFLLLSAGCAIGLGNIWRFPYITGQYGGAIFVLLYLMFLVIFGIPILTMEFSVGRASQKSVALSFQQLEPKGTKWHLYGYIGMAGNYLLMMFYTTVAGWMLAYLVGMARGDFAGLSSAGVAAYFESFTASPGSMVGWMAAICVIGFGICAIGLQNGVERITKYMMGALFAVMLLLVIRALTLPGAAEGLRFYLMPNWDAVRREGLGTVLYAAMGQSFFTLSIGIGSMAIFGSYIGKDHRLLGESVKVTVLDTTVAIMAGLIIFPACMSFGVNPGAGPSLIFISLPQVFNAMPLPRLWGALFFVFMTFAAISTVIAVFENIISFAIDLKGVSRRKAAVYNCIALVLLSLPCALGFNLLSGVHPLGEGSVIMDFLDFIVSNNLLPLGSLVYLFFCVSKRGWGWKNFLAEADAGKGARFPAKLKIYFRFFVPVLILIIFVVGYVDKFVK
jgi:NSS family neurotransmitter:Na+ symporter